MGLDLSTHSIPPQTHTRADLNLEELRELIQEAGRPIIVCNLDCGSQTNDASLFEIALNAETDKFQVKVLAYQ